MGRGLSGAVLRGFGARDHIATVLETEQITPRFLRVRMVSPTLFDDATDEPAAWLRFWFPDPNGSSAEHQRAYTLSEADPDAGTFAIDVVLHDPSGPASKWARTVAPGTTIAAISMMGSLRFAVPAEPPRGYLLIGDAAAITAVNGIIATVPDTVPIELYLEQHDADDRAIPLAEHPRLRVHWVPRRTAASVAEALENRDWSDWYAWATPEAGTLKHVRSRLREFGFPKSAMHTQAYWTAGRAMGKYRDGDSTETPEAPAASAVSITSVAAAKTPSNTETAETRAASETRETDIADDTVETPVTSEPVHQGRWQSQGAGRLLAPLRTPMLLSGALQAVISVVQLVPFLLLVELARRLLAGAPAQRLWPVGIAAVILLGLGTLLGAALTLWLHVVDARFARDVRIRLLDKLARLPLGWFTARGSGSVKHLVADDTQALHYLITHAIPDAVAAVVTPVAVLTYLIVVDWRVALVLLVPVLIYITTMTLMSVQSGTQTIAAQRWSETMTTEAAGYLAAQPVIRVFGGAAASTFRARLGEYLRFLTDWQGPLTGKKTVMDLVTRPATFLWLITGVGTLLVVAGRMDPVDLLPFLLLGTAFGAQLLGIGYGLSGIRDGLLAARRVQNALDETELAEPAGLTEPEDPAHRTTADAAVRFDRVRFGYRPDVPVIDDVSLTLAPGTVTALVGPSGSGKSTLAALLARFYDVDAGSIRVGGDDIRALSSDDLYRRVGFVLQDPQLVAASVYDNIALAVPDAAPEAVHAAAAAAQIHDRILALPDGYATQLGPDAALSGGERQRLTIARAILADTPVLILDEATAYADPESEYQVQQALSRLTADRTVLVIAYRLHTITGADQILVLDGGRIVERGTHPELLAADGRYRRLWETGRAGQPTAVAR